MKSVWNTVKDYLRSHVSESSFEVWIEPIQVVDVKEDTLILGCPNRFFASWVQEHYLPLLSRCPELENRMIRLTCDYKKENSAEAFLKQPENQAQQAILPDFNPRKPAALRFSRHYSFDEFVVGECNRYAHDVCKAIASGEISQGHILYLHSPSGLGKSHLSQATGQFILENRPSMRIAYLSANELTNQVVRAAKDGQFDGFKQKYQQECDILLLEEVHCLSGRQRTQAELSLIIDTLMESGKTIVMTANQPPVQLANLHEGLGSRLNAAIMANIDEPDQQTRRNILAVKALRNGLVVPDIVLDYLAERLFGDVRRLEGAVAGLLTRTTLMKQEVTLQLAQEVLGDMVGQPLDLNIQAIQEMLCRFYKLTTAELTSKSRKRSVLWPRQLGMYLARQYTCESLEIIGKTFGRDHATVIHAVKQVQQIIKDGGKLKAEIDFLSTQLEKMRWRGK
ncbi:MAG: chromosomal replication initiator protein DnaA [Dissulfuribacterales bacterium]